MVSLFGCNDKPKAPDGFKANQAELSQDWGQFKHDTSFNVWVFSDAEYPVRPAEHRTPQGARVFYNGDVSAEELQLIDEGLTEMLAMCMQDTVNWNPGSRWKDFLYFTHVSDYKIIFVPSNYTLQESEAAGCAGMITGAHGAYTAAGTVGGLNDRINNHTPGSRGGVYIIVPKQSTEQFTRAECKQLFKNAVKHEAEHILFSNDPALYFAFANDGAGGVGHPYCRGMQPF